MRFWNKRRETGLERELRAQRPQPPAELVQRLCRESATARRSLRSLLPRIALVAAVTVVLVASLGAAGAVGYATKSVQALGSSVLHVVQSPQSAKTHGSQLGNKGNGNEGKGNGNGQGGDGDDHGHDPFHHEYGHRVPICHHGEVIFVPSREYFYRLLHGDTPAPCRPRRRR
jgi:hypothetical protein